jgi:hypothetical protein
VADFLQTFAERIGHDLKQSRSFSL